MANFGVPMFKLLEARFLPVIKEIHMSTHLCAIISNDVITNAPPSATADCALNEKIQWEMQLFNNHMAAQFAQEMPVLHETVLYYLNEMSPAQLDDRLVIVTLFLSLFLATASDLCVLLLASKCLHICRQ